MVEPYVEEEISFLNKKTFNKRPLFERVVTRGGIKFPINVEFSVFPIAHSLVNCV